MAGLKASNENVFFDYDLPKELIAQEPAAKRDQSRLLVVARKNASLVHHVFSELPDLLNRGDLLILNDSRVLAARLLGRRLQTGGKWEGLFLRETMGGTWEILCQTRGRLAAGEWIAIDPGPLQLQIVARQHDGSWLVRPSVPGKPTEILARHGQVPLPPYIRKGTAEPADRERYQTVYARQAGAVAAPTAGLHFTQDLLRRLADRGIEHAFVTLHVGVGTFQSIQVDDYREHKMHREWAELPAAAVEAIHRCRERNGRIIAVGTTCARVLETVAAGGRLQPWSGQTQLYIYPPYEFKLVDGLITNFHLPRTSLLLLVAAFAGTELTRLAYEAAIREGYRFYSYGDAMVIL
jgi:S-adenosylmethionine:tRNA ribosyltransferase-isomerase